MRIYDIAFYIAGFFMLGVLGASSGLNFLIILMATILTVAVFLLIGYLTPHPSFRRVMGWLAGLAAVIIIGAFYYFWWSNFQIGNLNIIFNEKINFQGVVVANPERGNQQKLVVELKSPYAGKVLVKLQPYPNFDYGDLINFEGVIKTPEPPSYADYLAKDGIFGIITFPKTELVVKNQGSSFKSLLFKFKEKIILNFQKVLASEKAAFLGGLTLGERAEFSKDFKEAMAKSGTAHIVALSGYNISIIVSTLGFSLMWVVGQRLGFILTTLIIIGFVAMTGAEASVVRAAIMGILVVLASQVGRLYSFRNAIALAAFFMILANPQILYFDIGFQLSFLAVLGIVYLKPAICQFLKFSEEQGLFLWRDIFLTTVAAQLSVAPILIIYFGNFSLISFLSNLLILMFIPLTMAVGFFIGALGFVSYYLSLIFGWFVNILLTYEIFIINFFGNLKVNILEFQSMNPAMAIFYYLALIIFIVYAQLKGAWFKRSALLKPSGDD